MEGPLPCTIRVACRPAQAHGNGEHGTGGQSLAGNMFRRCIREGARMSEAMPSDQRLVRRRLQLRAPVRGRLPGSPRSSPPCGCSVKVVLTMGTFDILHEGHSRYLEAARGFGDFLIVGVDNDEKVRGGRGPWRPAVPELERLRMVTHQRGVGLVTLKPADETAVGADQCGTARTYSWQRPTPTRRRRSPRCEEKRLWPGRGARPDGDRLHLRTTAPAPARIGRADVTTVVRENCPTCCRTSSTKSAARAETDLALSPCAARRVRGAV